MFIPNLQGYIISEAAVICDYPMETEEIGKLVFQFFEQMKQRNLMLHTPYKKYWFMPKGIRSYKKYVEATAPITLEWNGDVFGALRWFPAPDRGFEPEGSGRYNATINTSVSAKDLGEFILQQFDYIEKKRRSS